MVGASSGHLTRGQKQSVEGMSGLQTMAPLEGLQQQQPGSVVPGKARAKAAPVKKRR
jgi:hypothetical protein